jgi:hypothetical protein
VGGGGIFGMAGAGTQGIINVTLTRCLCYDIKKLSASTSASIFTAHLANNLSVINMTNCTFYMNALTDTILTGFSWIWSAASGALTWTIKNCIIDAPTSMRYQALGSGNNTDLSIYTITYSDVYNFTNTPTLGTGTITSDPLMVDPANANFGLRPTSPCINTGTLI